MGREDICPVSIRTDHRATPGRLSDEVCLCPQNVWEGGAVDWMQDLARPGVQGREPGRGGWSMKQAGGTPAQEVAFAN